MLEKFHQFAETAATNASRREFMGRLGRGAIAAAMGLGGMLVVGGNVEAARGRKCLVDSDCPQGRSCIDGRCVKGPKCKRERC